jgi:hypothetical protein
MIFAPPVFAGYLQASLLLFNARAAVALQSKNRIGCKYGDFIVVMDLVLLSPSSPGVTESISSFE